MDSALLLTMLVMLVTTLPVANRQQEYSSTDASSRIGASRRLVGSNASINQSCASGYFERMTLHHGNGTRFITSIPNHLMRCDACQVGHYQPAPLPGVYRFLKFTPTGLRSSADCVQVSEVGFFTVVKRGQHAAQQALIFPLRIRSATNPSGS